MTRNRALVSPRRAFDPQVHPYICIPKHLLTAIGLPCYCLKDCISYCTRICFCDLRFACETLRLISLERAVATSAVTAAFAFLDQLNECMHKLTTLNLLA